VVEAPAHWRTIDFISDLHLQAGQPATYQAWQRYMASTPADAVFILGDLFEVWVGDDVTRALPGQPPNFEAQCQGVLGSAAIRLSLFFIHGNRDFLLGDKFAAACHMALLPDPCALVFDAQRWLLSHGDALCLDDTAYQQFRSLVRSPAWRNEFLAKPLTERQAIARALRLQSETRKTSGANDADVDSAAARQWLDAAQASTLIHGHTHRPADHVLRTQNPVQQRLVLSDWDAQATPPRLQVLRLQAGHAPQRLALEM
jgi:UDP-2,3-diacylglucosamine hydrolase